VFYLSLNLIFFSGLFHRLFLYLKNVSLFIALDYYQMTFTKLVSNIFYADIKSGNKMFVDCLGFTIGHNEIETRSLFCVVEKYGLRVNLFQNEEPAKKDNPEFRLVTDNIQEVYDTISPKFPELLHPNLSRITLRPWGAKEFALMDDQIGIVIQQW
jgi:hypothetical protein